MIKDTLTGGGILFWSEDMPVWLFREGEDPAEFFSWLYEQTGVEAASTPYQRDPWRSEMILSWRRENEQAKK